MLAITMIGLVVLFIPCYLGIRLGAGFATLLGVVSMVPLTLLVILPVFKPSTFHWSNVSGFHYVDPKTAGVSFFLGWLFVISWNGIGVEAAACYVAECRDPRRDAKIALTAEGLYGLFIYAATAIVFVAVLGASLKTSDPLTLYTSFANHIFGSAGWVKYLIGIPLIFALLLSVLNAIMGVGRSLFQASEDRLIPKFFSHKNKHHSPDRAMLFNLVCAMIVALFGSPVRIYIFSNVGYLIAIIAALFGYFMVRQFRKDQISPFRLHGAFRWIALAMALGLTFVYFVGGWGSPDIVVGPGQGHTLYILGFVVVAAYVPLHLWRRMTDRRDGVPPLGTCPSWWGRPAVSTSATWRSPTSWTPTIGCHRHGGCWDQPGPRSCPRCRLGQVSTRRAARWKNRPQDRQARGSERRNGTSNHRNPRLSLSPRWGSPFRRRLSAGPSS